MKKKILIISGGISKERVVSLETGKQVAKELKKNNYLVKICEPDKKLISVIENFRPHCIFNALHGQFGEEWFKYYKFNSKKQKIILALSLIGYDTREVYKNHKLYLKLISAYRSRYYYGNNSLKSKSIYNIVITHLFNFVLTKK